MSTVKIVAALVSCAFLTPAFAQSLAERRARAVEDKTLGFYERLAGDCRVDAYLDWSTFTDGALALKKKNIRLSEVCRFALEGIGRVCGKGEDAKKSVQANVKYLTCKQASPSTVTLKDGRLVYGIDFKEPATAGADNVEKFLMEKLSLM